MARFRVRDALHFHGLGEYADDAEIITSELVTNAIDHVYGDNPGTIGITLTCARDLEAVTVVVSDSSPQAPALREASSGSECGRGLQIVAALSAHWGWRPEGCGKAIFVVLAQEAAT